MVDTRTNPGKAAFAGALAAVVVGLCVLVGWLFDLEFLKRIAPDLVAMNPATAVAFILAGASLALLLQSPRGRDQKSRALILTARLCALVVTLIGLARLADILFGSDLGVDQWLFASNLADGLRPPNRIAPNTALNFLLLGSALLFVDVEKRSVRLGVEFSVVLVGLGSLLAVLAYGYDIQSLYGLGAFLPMALHTAITFSVLVVALLLSHTDRGLLAVFAGDSAGGTMARRLLPAAVLVPAVLGWLTREGEMAGLYHGGFGGAAFAVGNILVFTFLVCWSARELFSADLVRKNAEVALQESEARTRLLVKSSNIGLWDWNLVTNQVFFSPEWKAQLGYADAELPSRFEEWESRLHPEDREPTLAAVKDYVEGHRVNYEVEFRLRHKEGSWRWILTRASLTRDAAGQPVHIRGCHIDITERKQAEEALRESEERFAGAFEHAPIGVALVSPQGRWLKANRALCDLVGYSEAALQTRTIMDLTHPADVELSRESMRRVVAGGSGALQIEKRYLHARGNVITALLNISLVRDGQGQPRYFVSQIQDITERKWAEAALKESESRYHSLFENMVEGYAYCRTLFKQDQLRDFTYVEVNAAFERLTGLKHVVGKKVSEVIPGVYEASPELFAVYGRVALTGRTERFETDLKSLGIWFSVTVYSSEREHFVAVFDNITVRKRAEAELEQAHQELVKASRQAGMAEVATNVLHNVGNVLNSVNVASSCLADSLRKSKAVNLSKVAAMLREHEGDLGAYLASDPKGKQLPGYLAQLAEHLTSEQAAALNELAQLQKNIEHIKEIVAMQQSHAKVSGVTELVKITELVEDTLRMNAGALVRHEVRVIREFDPLLPEFPIDRHKVLQILVNLVRNAKYACAESGRTDKQLTVRVTNGDDRVRIAVTDNGVGIAPENLTRIFAHGFTTKKDGHGFGLHSGALAAKEMGGALTVNSDGPGRGATFTLELPLQPPGASAATTTDALAG